MGYQGSRISLLKEFVVQVTDGLLTDAREFLHAANEFALTVDAALAILFLGQSFGDFGHSAIEVGWNGNLELFLGSWLFVIKDILKCPQKVSIGTAGWRMGHVIIEEFVELFVQAFGRSGSSDGEGFLLICRPKCLG